MLVRDTVENIKTGITSICKGKADKQRLVSSSFLPHLLKNTHPKAILIICTPQRKPLFLIYLFQFISSLWLHTHTLTKTLTCNAGKTNALLICPPRGFGSSLWNLHLSRQESTWKRNKGPTPHCHLAKSVATKDTRLYCTEWDYTQRCAHTHTHIFTRGSALLLRHRSNIDLTLESDGEVRESGCKRQFKHTINHALWKFQIYQ